MGEVVYDRDLDPAAQPADRIKAVSHIWLSSVQVL